MTWIVCLTRHLFMSSLSFPGALRLAHGHSILSFKSSNQVRATKPGFDLGAKAPLKKKDQPVTLPAAVTSWAAAGDGDELMDDEELLTEEDKRPVNPASECGPSH